MVVLQTGVLPEQLLLVRQATQRPTLVLQYGVAPLHWLFIVQPAMHLSCVGSHTGVEPLQAMHEVPQACAVLHAIQPLAPQTTGSLPRSVSVTAVAAPTRSAASDWALFDVPQMKRSGVLSVMPAATMSEVLIAKSAKTSASPPNIDVAGASRA